MNHALAALTLAINSVTESPSAAQWLRVLPMGEFKGVDGRPVGMTWGKGTPVECKSWLLTQEQGQKLVAVLKARQDDLVIDYEHQTLKAAENGQPAPAAGWMKDFELREDGLYALCEFTPNAQAMIDNKEYRYISPVFPFHHKTGLVTALLNVALTNAPALDGLTDVMAKAALSLFSSTPKNEDSAMDELLERLRWMLNLPISATVDEVKAELQKLAAMLTEGQATAAASVDLLALLANQTQQIAALSQQLTTQATATPDPTKFVPIDVVNGLHQQIAALSQQQQQNQADELVTAALNDNRILPAEESWLRGMAKSNFSAAKSYIDARQPIAALSQTQTSVTKTLATQEADLDATALAICSKLGITKEQFKAQQALLSK
ncbi:phage protease [Agitococcus lubricus]|uniref:Phage I-like protein n=1 Tax=Agitococcus lubricus TaxID=1077255 RepID=A0A2T5J3Y2_9GAMM|nr:phage protease [Agitococcus lubricus]PTQ91266.1 phage I-like protein [Agitococcus lubricus]